MNVNERDRRSTGVPRGAGQRTPRSGGRTTAERIPRGGSRIPSVEQDAHPAGAPSSLRRERVSGPTSRGGEFPVVGSAALRAVERAEQVEVDEVTPPRLRVAPPPPVKVPQAPFAALIVALVVGGVLGILVVNTKINENAFRLNNLQKQQAKLDVDQQQLERQIAEASAPGNLAANARKLGLVESGPPAYIRLPDGKTIGVPQPAGGQPAVTSQQNPRG